MNRAIKTLILLLVVISCAKDDNNSSSSVNINSEFISAVDISNYPEILNVNPTFYNLD